MIGGNAELLLEEELPKNSYKSVKTIVESNNQVKKYVTSLLETSAGTDETFESVKLSSLFNELCQNTIPIAENYRVFYKLKIIYLVL